MRRHCTSIATPGSCVGLLAVLATAVLASAAWADLYWDMDGATPGAGGASPAGTWNAGNTNWSTSSAGDVATVAWTPGEIAVFAAGTNATGPYMITVSGTQQIGGLRFEEGTVTLSSGGTLSFNGPVTFRRETAPGDTQINSAVQGNGVLTLESAGGTYIRLNGIVSDSGGALSVRQTSGSWVLNAQHTYSGGTTITGGIAIPLQDSTGPAGAPTSGPFGTGTLVLQGGTLRPGGSAGGTIGNAVSLDGNFTFGTGDSSRPIVFTGPLTLTGDRTLTFSGNSTTTFSGALGDGGSGFGFTKAGSQTLTLAGANTYGGITTVSTGTLIIQHAQALGATAGGTVVNNGATLQLQGNIAVGAEALTIGGEGVGSQGALRNASGNNSWAGPIEMRAGVTSRIQSDAGKLTISGTITSLGTNSLYLSGAGDGEVSGAIAALHQLVKQGAGTWTLSGANTYTNPTVVEAGALVLANTSGNSVASSALNVGAGSVPALLLLGASNQINDAGVLTLAGAGANAGIFRLAGHSDVIGGLVSTGGAGIVENESGTPGTSTLTLSASSGTRTYSGVLRDGDGAGTDGVLALVKTGGGTQVLAGANSYSGATTVTGGVLNIQNALALGTTAGGTTVASGARIELQGGITVAGETITISGSGGNNYGALQSASGDNVWNGPVFLGSGDTRVGANAGSLTIGGPIQDGAQTTVIVRNNAGATIFSGASTYSGETRVYNGVLKIDGGHDRLPTGTALRVGLGALVAHFDLNGYNQTVGGILADNSPTSSITNTGAAPSVLTVHNAADFDFAGLLTEGDQPLSFVKSGPARQTLSNAANNFSGDVTVLEGMLSAPAVADAGAPSPLGAGSRIFLGGASTTGTWRYSGSGAGSTDRLITLNAGGGAVDVSIAAGVLTLAGQVTGPGALAKIGPGTLVLTDPGNDFAGNVAVQEGVLSAGDVADSGAASPLGRGNGIALGGASTAGTLRFTATAADSTNRPVALNAGGGAIDVYSTAGSLTLSGQVGGPGGLTKTGAGTLTLTAANSYNGTTTVSAGVLNVRNAQALGATAGGTTVTSGARLELQGGITVSGESLTIDGGGGNFFGALQNVGGNNTWDGPVLLNGGDPRVGTASGILTISGVVQNGTGNTFQVRSSTGPGIVIVTAANAYTGGTNVIVGTLRIAGGDNRLPVGTLLTLGNAANLDAATFDLNGFNQQLGGLASPVNSMPKTVTNAAAAPAVLTLNTAADRAYAGAVTGNLALTKQGSAAQTLSGAYTYSGPTDVQAGTLRLAAGNTLPNSPLVRVAQNAVLDVSGVTGGQFNLVPGQTLKGNGTVLGNLNVAAGAVIAAGDSPGHLSVAGNYLQAGTMEAEIGGYVQGVDYDWTSATGTGVLDGTLAVSLFGGFQPESGDTFYVFTAAGGITDNGLELSWAPGQLAPAQYWDYQIVPWTGAGGGEALQLTLGVPEPATVLLLALGAAAWLLWAARRRRACQAG